VVTRYKQHVRLAAVLQLHLERGRPNDTKVPCFSKKAERGRQESNKVLVAI
jgi:hypothetical protein